MGPFGRLPHFLAGLTPPIVNRDLYRQRSRVEGELGNLKHEWGLLPLRVRGLTRVALHVDLTILTKLTSRLAQDRMALRLAA